MSVINTNVKALAAQGSLSNVNKALGTSMERLSTGLRINSAADDAAGLAITNRMTSQIRGYAVAIRNSNDGISMAQTAEGAMGQVTGMLQRMRELAVQSANGAVTSDDRKSIQQEVTQLKAQIQDIAVKTNHNNINLLDGSAGNIVLQTGVNANDTMSMQFGSLQTKDIGLGSRTALTSTGGLVSGEVNAAMVDGDVTLNGVVVGASLAADDTVSVTADKAKSAIAKAAAINKVSAQSGVVATVGQTAVTGAVMTDATAGISGVVVINGVTSATFYLSGNKELDRTAVSTAINDMSARTGVTASNTHDNNQGVKLNAADGRNIVLATTGSTATSAKMGLAADGTYVGSYSLNTQDGSDFTVGTTVAQSQKVADHSGLRLGTYQADTAQTQTIKRAAATTAGGSGVLNGNTLTINGVGIQAGVGADDKASYANTQGSVLADSAIAIAAAINKSTDLTGVKATAASNVLTGTGFTAGTVTAIVLNGTTFSPSVTSGYTRESMVDLLNTKSGETGVVASAYGDGIKLEAADGRNISIEVTGATSAATGASALGLTGVTVGATGASGTSNAATYYAGVVLSSDKAFTVDSGSEGDAANLEKLGFRQGTFGGSTDDVKVKDIDVTTQASSAIAIKALDAAIQTVGENQAKAGAFQNRLDAVVSNLTESNQNMSASRSRILDTDYASETTNMARSQIIAQAATAMLAQANQSAQSVLSLLK